MNQKQLAAALGVTPAAVSKLVRRGMPASDLDAAKAWRAQHLDPGRVKGNRPHVDSGSATGAATPYTVARTERERTRAARETLELARLRGNLIDVDEVSSFEFTAARITRDCMEQIPARFVAELHALILSLVPEEHRQSVARGLELHAVERRLGDEIRQALKQAAVAIEGLNEEAVGDG